MSRTGICCAQNAEMDTKSATVVVEEKNFSVGRVGSSGSGCGYAEERPEVMNVMKGGAV